MAEQLHKVGSGGAGPRPPVTAEPTAKPAGKPRGASSKLPGKPCHECGRAIPPARLEAVPGTDLCVDCSRKHPQKIDPRTIDISQSPPIDRTGFGPSE